MLDMDINIFHQQKLPYYKFKDKWGNENIPHWQEHKIPVSHMQTLVL